MRNTCSYYSIRGKVTILVNFLLPVATVAENTRVVVFLAASRGVLDSTGVIFGVSVVNLVTFDTVLELIRNVRLASLSISDYTAEMAKAELICVAESVLQFGQLVPWPTEVARGVGGAAHAVWNDQRAIYAQELFVVLDYSDPLRDLARLARDSIFRLILR